MSTGTAQTLVTGMLIEAGAFWQHSGNPSDPHAELTSGKCSDGFVNVLNLLCDPQKTKKIAEYLAFLLSKHYTGRVDWVVGSDHAAATLSYAVAYELRAKHDFTEKGPDGIQVWKRFTIRPDEYVLQVEELVTTNKTAMAVKTGIKNAHEYEINFVPAVLTVVDRSGSDEIDGAKLLCLANYDINIWDPSECPLCKQGSKRLRPKVNWAELTGR